MTPQYVMIEFNEWSRPYIYANHLERVKPGDRVEVETRRDGPVTVKVVSVSDTAPDFACKKITRVVAP